MNSILLNNYNIHFLSKSYTALNECITANSYTKIIVLVDAHTHQACLGKFLGELDQTKELEIIEIEPGESHKSLETCQQIWQSLADLNADRQSLLINLGGGIVTDIGGFTASCFKRGIDFIHIPTTLLGMVDAAIGGKNGVNLGELKNQVGVIKPPQHVLIDPTYLATLSQEEMRSGLAEMIKHGIIADQTYLDQFTALEHLGIETLNDLIYESIQIKTKIAEQDPNEQGLRKALNFGHTLGHAIESYSMKELELPKLLHGEAVAIGMVLALYLSSELTGLTKDDCGKYTQLLFTYYKAVNFSDAAIKSIKELLIHDKKNTAGNINFVLLERIGKPVFDCQVSNQLIDKAFHYYAQQKTLTTS